MKDYRAEVWKFQILSSICSCQQWFDSWVNVIISFSILKAPVQQLFILNMIETHCFKGNGWHHWFKCLNFEYFMVKSPCTQQPTTIYKEGKCSLAVRSAYFNSMDFEGRPLSLVILQYKAIYLASV